MNLTTALYAHLAGDYLLQNDWMAAGKKRSSFICGVHVLLYLVPFVICGATPFQVFAIGVQHFAQDRWTFVPWLMRNAGQAKFADPPLAPWSFIVVDNVLHLVWNAAVISLFP